MIDAAPPPRSRTAPARLLTTFGGHPATLAICGEGRLAPGAAKRCGQWTASIGQRMRLGNLLEPQDAAEPVRDDVEGESPSHLRERIQFEVEVLALTCRKCRPR